MRWLFRPSILIPGLLAVALLLTVLSLGDVRTVGQAIARFPHRAVVVVFALLWLNMALHGVQWWLLVRRLRPLPARCAALAFAGGEATESLPVGIYFANVLLERASGQPAAYTAAATMVSILLEVACCCIYLAVVGIPGWPWLRPLIIGGLAAVALGGLALERLHWHAGLPPRLRQQSAVRWLGNQVRQFRQGARRLADPSLLLAALGLAAAYLAIAGAAFFVILRALGVAQLSFWRSLAAYMFGLGSGIILPTPTEVGVSELTGVGALQASGVGLSPAASAELLYRALFIGAALLGAAVVFALMPQQTGRLLRRPAPPEPREVPEPSAR